MICFAGHEVMGLKKGLRMRLNDWMTESGLIRFGNMLMVSKKSASSGKALIESRRFFYFNKARAGFSQFIYVRALTLNSKKEKKHHYGAKELVHFKVL